MGILIKSAAVVLGALVCGWLTMEIALKPLLEKARVATVKTDPTTLDSADDKNMDDQSKIYPADGESSSDESH
ncbi:hypothetical protein LguiA_011480 [Lonicera macranthoides]